MHWKEHIIQTELQVWKMPQHSFDHVRTNEFDFMVGSRNEGICLSKCDFDQNEIVNAKKAGRSNLPERVGLKTEIAVTRLSCRRKSEKKKELRQHGQHQHNNCRSATPTKFG